MPRREEPLTVRWDQELRGDRPSLLTRHGWLIGPIVYRSGMSERLWNEKLPEIARRLDEDEARTFERYRLARVGDQITVPAT